MSKATNEQKIIELSVEESNHLRAELGLPPLRTDKQENEKKEVLELSVDATNALRENLGLAPLRTSAELVQHAPAINQGDTQAAAERIEQAKLKRQVQQGVATQFQTQSLGEEDGGSAKSWAQQMRSKKNESSSKQEKKKETTKNEPSQSYNESDLHGLTVGHAVSELEQGSTTVLTLSDAPLLQKADDVSQKIVGLNEQQQLLQNVELAEQQHVQAGLRQKRQVELGMGRAGGYAGFDDDEFVELGGTQAPSRFARGSAVNDGAQQKQQATVRGFQIGANYQEQDEQLESDLFAKDRAVSLEPSTVDVAASDFMTVEEDEQELKKKMKFKKKKKDKKKKLKKKKSRRETTESDDDEQQQEQPKEKKRLLDELEETAVETTAKTMPRKRRRLDSEDEDDTKNETTSNNNNAMEIVEDKRSKYEQIMAKGNERSRLAFGGTKNARPSNALDDEEPDDAFLNAALAKARRLNRLKEISSKQQQDKPNSADAVAAAVVKQEPTGGAASSASGGTMVFAVDETREFTRALRAKEEQTQRVKKSATAVKKEEEEEAVVDNAMDIDNNNDKGEVKPLVTTVVKKEEQAEAEEEEEEVDIHELAKEVKEEDVGGLDGTGQTVPLGRGVGNLLGLLKHTGEMTRKNAGKEEMRGRAKDERTYEDYEPLDLKKVVKIDDNRATSKDKEFATRQVKLEYRDHHGRLLTRKQAFRDLSYHFHGYGSGKRKEEKKMEQIAREQAEARLAAAEGAGAGTFGAVKATQKATGKAFIVHKTGT